MFQLAKIHHVSFSSYTALLPPSSNRSKNNLGISPLSHLQSMPQGGLCLGMANKSITSLQPQELVRGWACESMWHNLGSLSRATEGKSSSVFQRTWSFENQSMELLAATLPLKRKALGTKQHRGQQKCVCVLGVGRAQGPVIPLEPLAADSKARSTLSANTFAFCLN